MVTGLPRDLKKQKYLIEWCAKRRHRLNVPVEVIFEMADWQAMNALAAYGGFPKRYPHWRFGMELVEQEKSYGYGLSKIYEMVINNDPCYAYLLVGNNFTDQQLVMAHVYFHADFFCNNIFFDQTNRKAVEMMEAHRNQVIKYEEKYGREEVESWLDTCLIMENLIDANRSAIKRVEDKKRVSFLIGDEEEEKTWSGKFDAKPYLDGFINPPAVVEEMRTRAETEKLERKKIDEKGSANPLEPERDILLFLAEQAPLENWQRDLLLLIREEAYYFLPQAQTKVMNEGWASYGHSQIMTRHGLAGDKGIIDYCDHNSGTLARHPGLINPYPMGRFLFEDIEWRWNTHRHGAIFNDCEEAAILNNWDQFVVFKNLKEDHASDEQAFQKIWREFLCFWRALKDGLGNMPRYFYDSELLIPLWDTYRRADELIDKLETEINEIHIPEALEFNRFKREAREEGLLAKEESWSFNVELVKDFIQLLKKERAVLLVLRDIRTAIRDGRILPEPFAIPEKFYSYAEKYPGPLKTSVGREKIFEVRKIYCDITFIDEFLTPQVCEKMELFTFKKNAEAGHFEIASREFDEIRRMYVAQLTNVFQPDIRIVDANYNNANELLLRHYVDGVFEIQINQAKEALMKAVYRTWQRPVYLETAFVKDDKEKRVRFRYDGKSMSQDNIDDFTSSVIITF